MRQAIRVYALVALVAMVVLVVGLWANPESLAGGEGWVDRTFGAVYGLQLWIWLVIPLGVLAASDAARTGRRGWLALFIALLVIAPFAAWIFTLTNNIQVLLAGPCLPGAACPSGPFGAPWVVTQVGWVVGFLPVPFAALVYSFTVAPNATEPAAAEADQGERRALTRWAIVGIVVMSALGYLGTSQFLLLQFATRSLAAGMSFSSLQGMLSSLWLTLAALPVAIASMALAHAARTGRHGWLAGWIALIALALLTADLGSFWGEIVILLATGKTTAQVPDAQYAISIAAPVVVMLVALLYARFEMRPRPSAAVLAVA